MIGHEGVATALVMLLRERGNDAARMVEQQQGLPAGTIEVPRKSSIFPTWRPTQEKSAFPTWMVVGLDTPIRRTAQRRGVGARYDETDWRYPFMIITHVSEDDYGRLANARFRLMLVVRTILIQTPGLISTEHGEVARIDLSESQERLFGQQQVDTTQHIAEGHNLFHVTTEEHTPVLQKVFEPVGEIRVGIEGMEHPTTTTPEGS